MINFSIEFTGWLDCSIETDNRSIKISHSYDYGNKWQDLLNVFFLMDHMTTSKFSEPYEIHKIDWIEDLCKYQWIITYNKTRSVDIEIIKLSEQDAEEIETLISFNITVSQLMRDIYESLKSLYLKFGIVGFRNAWEIGNFPIAEYIILSSRYNQIELKEYNVYEHDDEGLKRFDLVEELKVLKLNN